MQATFVSIFCKFLRARKFCGLPSSGKKCTVLASSGKKCTVLASSGKKCTVLASSGKKCTVLASSLIAVVKEELVNRNFVFFVG